MTTATAVFGAAIRRREDPRFITGKGNYTDDIQLAGMVYAAFLRSPHAHARVVRVDTTRAREADGVLAVYTAEDIKGHVNPIPTAWLIPDSDLKTPPYPALADGKVRYVGDRVAMVVAASREAARDAVDLIEVEYEPLPVVVDQEKAVQEGAPQLHDDVPGNLAFHWRAGNGADAAFAEAEVVVKQRFRNQRLIPNPMEPRAAVARYDAGSDEMTVWVTSQNPHIHRVLLSGILGVPEHKLRIVAPDVGGGFGAKIPCYADEALVAFASQQLGRPVKWTEDRQENFIATSHGRDHVMDVELAGRRDGTITGIRVKTWANMGAYLSTAAPGVPTILFGLMVQGCYRIPAAEVDVYGVFTNTTPTDAYRGAGRPEATYLVERMVDLFAAEIGKDPVDVRRQNLLAPDAFPYATPTGLEYDSGNYQAVLDKALEMVDYPALRAEQERLRAQGRHIGIGVVTYVEICGLGPSQVAGAVGFQGGLWESATVRVHPTGKVTVFTGTAPHGQGEATTFAQIVADQFGIPIDDVDVVYGDTDRISMGWGTYGSRTTPVGGSAIAVAAERVIEKAQKIAAHMLEASPDDVEFADGAFEVKGMPDRRATFQEVALQAYLAWDLPAGIEPALEAQAFYDPVNFCYPFGAHVCVVEVDPETGQVDILRYIAVDDCGRIINPMIVEGQVHGGIVQGVGQALWEQAVYSENGQLMTGSFMDYAMPKARFFPDIETAHTETPAPHNPLGVKGVGETGTIASTPTVVNAVMDALRPFGVRDLDMPLTPEKVWRAMKDGRATA